MSHVCDCRSHSQDVLSQWQSFIRHTDSQDSDAVIDGHSLDIATVVAVARYGALARLHDRTRYGVAESAKLLRSGLEQGDIIYGVNTGFGGSADTRTNEIEELQATLVRELHSGIVINPTLGQSSSGEAMMHSPGKRPLLVDDSHSNTCMPEAWARASILVRVNSLASGHSGVRPILIDNMVVLLRENIVPQIPLRGSISASGDLMPLSYIGGTLEGKRGVTVWAGNRMNRRTVTADVALKESSLDSIKLGPKEGLAIINGTAVSTGVAALAVFDANNIAVLSQVLTAMSVEALRGTDESFDPFFAAVRPHPGQIEAARNIQSFLTGSKLVQHNDGSEPGALRQDRYSIRTAPQWLGPILEDLQLAFRQITIECNSATDNPLIDVDLHQTKSARILHGGNFQAKAVTSAMEKVRLALQTIGQMLFAQCTEIINPRLNYGLPPSLAVDEPSQSFLLKPVDIMIAALQSELGFLSNPAGTHVQSAEMGNQALNSLGLISARYTHTALEVLSQLASAHLFTLCQALDLRALNSRFLEDVEPMLRKYTAEIFANILDESVVPNEATNLISPPRLLQRSCDNGRVEGDWNGQDGSIRDSSHISTTRVATAYPLISHIERSFNGILDFPEHSAVPPQKMREMDDENLCIPALLSGPSHLDSGRTLENLHLLLWKAFTTKLDETTTLDSSQRFSTVFRSLQPIVLDFASSSVTVSAVKKWTEECSSSALKMFIRNRDSYHACPDASHLLGTASRRMYRFVRDELHVPFLRTSMLRNRDSKESSLDDNRISLDGGTELNDHDQAFPDLTTGALISTIYQSIRAGSLYGSMMECLLEAEKMS